MDVGGGCVDEWKWRHLSGQEWKCWCYMEVEEETRREVKRTEEETRDGGEKREEQEEEEIEEKREKEREVCEESSILEFHH